MTKLTTNFDKWKKESQSGELVFHMNDKFRPSGELDRESEILFNQWGFGENDYANKLIIDAGCGSMLRTKYFRDSIIVGIEPLAHEYSKIDWCDLQLAKAIYAVPLEEHLGELINVADLIVSINVLDHCYDFQICIENLYSYLKSNGLCFLSYDAHEKGMDRMHPLDLNDGVSRKVFEHAGFVIEKFEKGRVYGGGDFSLNYWLRKG